MKRKIVFLGIALLSIGIVSIIFSLVQVPFQEQEPYNALKSYVLYEESFTVPKGEISGRSIILKEGEVINLFFRVKSGGNLDLDFYFRNDQNTTFHSLSRVTSLNDTMTIPANAKYYAVWDNTFNWEPHKGITTTITKLWNEISYRDVTVYHTILSSEYSTITEFIGISFLLAGIAIMGWGFASKEKVAFRF